MDIGPRVFCPDMFFLSTVPNVRYTDSEEDRQLLAEAIAAHPEMQPYEVLLRGIQSEGPSIATPRELRRTAPPIIFLADVRIIMGFLIEAPPEWVRYVAVDERSPKSERRAHYIATGRLLREDSRVRQEFSNTSGVWPERLYHDFNLEYDPIISRDAINPVVVEELLAIEPLNILSGIRHNALLQMIDRRDAEDIIGHGPSKEDRRGDPDWTLINWTDVCDFVNFNWFRMKYKTSPSDLISLINTSNKVSVVAYAYAGRRVLKAPNQAAIFSPGLSSPSSPGRVTYTLKTLKRKTAPIVVHISHLSLLYDRTLHSLTREDGASVYDAVKLGLSPILTGGRYRDINSSSTPAVVIAPASRGPHDEYEASVFSLLPIIHLTILLEVPRRRVDIKKRYNEMTLEPKDFVETIQLIIDTLGTIALVTFVATLMEYHSEDKKAMLFCEKALERIPDDEALMGFQQLPE